MNRIKLTLLIAMFGFMINAKAQVKIGNNPGSIGINSLLELESTNKGFLAPRVTLIHTDSASPLKAPVTAGMLVYNNAGSLAKGYYAWNGTKWQPFSMANAVRNNYVLVKSAADFPAPVSGIITLDSNTVYEINGTITMTSQININEATIVGRDRDNDQLIYTPTSGALFTGSTGGHIHSLSLSATGTGGKLFDMDASTKPTALFLIEFSYIINTKDIGHLKGFYILGMQTCGFSGNINGILFEDISNLININSFWIEDNQGTYEKYVGTFDKIQIIGGERNTLAVFSAKAMDISGLTSITNGAYMKNTFFSGDGVRVIGTFSKEWEIECGGLNTEKDETATGNIYISSAATTTFSASGVPVKVKGTTTAANLFRTTSPVSNRLVYTGTKTRRFQVICSLSAVQPSSSKYFSFYIAKNGTVLPESRQEIKIINSSDQGPVTLSCTVQLAPNEYIEVWVENEFATTDLTVQTMNLAIK